jgi:hypothetical protein
MYIEKLHVQFTSKYQIAGKTKTAKPTQHETPIGELTIDYGIELDALEKTIDALMESFHDYTIAKITIETSNL